MFSCKSLSSKDLLNAEESAVYAQPVTDEQFWKAVGAELAKRRRLAGIPSTFTYYKQHHGAPAINTLDSIEEGRPGRVSNLDSYCRGLRTTTADVFRAVLDAADGLGPTISDEEWKLIQTFRDIPASPGRDAWLVLGESLRDAHDDLDPGD